MFHVCCLVFALSITCASHDCTVPYRTVLCIWSCVDAHAPWPGGNGVLTMVPFVPFVKTQPLRSR